jgi:hypothetical protein
VANLATTDLSALKTIVDNDTALPNGLKGQFYGLMSALWFAIYPTVTNPFQKFNGS